MPLAKFSPDGRYRYILARNLGFQGDGRVTFVMLNPSTADEHRNDPTVQRCVNFGRAWGYGWLYVVNLSPLRATDPNDLLAEGPEPADVWETNVDYIQKAVSLSDLVVAAWGVHGEAEGRAERVLDALLRKGWEVHCLGTTKHGHPRHPLYIPKATAPVRFAPVIGI